MVIQITGTRTIWICRRWDTRCTRTPATPTTHNPVFITDERSSYFNLLCCSLTASFPRPHPFPCPLPLFSSFFLSYTLGETTPLSNPSCCSFLGDCSYFPRRTRGHVMVLVFAYLSIPMYCLLCQKSYVLSRPPLPIPWSVFRTHCSPFSLRVLLFLLVSCLVIGFPFLSQSLTLFLHHNLQRLHLAIDHIHLPTTASTMHSLYTFGYLSRTFICPPGNIHRS